LFLIFLFFHSTAKYKLAIEEVIRLSHEVNRKKDIERMNRDDEEEEYEEDEMDDEMDKEKKFQGNKKNVYIFAKKDPHRYMEGRNI